MLSDGFDLAVHKPVIDTALRDAIPNGDLLTIHLLVQAGADVNTRYDDGDTPLVSVFIKFRAKFLSYERLLAVKPLAKISLGVFRYLSLKVL